MSKSVFGSDYFRSLRKFRSLEMKPIALILAVCLLQACGQKGDLYLPVPDADVTVEQAQQPDNDLEKKKQDSDDSRKEPVVPN